MSLRFKPCLSFQWDDGASEGGFGVYISPQLGVFTDDGIQLTHSNLLNNGISIGRSMWFSEQDVLCTYTTFWSNSSSEILLQATRPRFSTVLISPISLLFSLTKGLQSPSPRVNTPRSRKLGSMDPRSLHSLPFRNL